MGNHFGRTLLAITVLGSCLQASLAFGQMAKKAATGVDLLSYTEAHVQDPATGVPKYDRLKNFGAWVKQDPSNSCYDTREMVLAKEDDPSVPVQMSAGGCTISSGLWHEPYTGVDVETALALQIDHVVPLANAWYAGAYAWTGPQRCNYTNFLGNDFHLRAVADHENTSKGDKGPDGYLPPDHSDRCSYVSDWMKIKMIWQLSASSAEFAAIQNVFQTEGCADTFRYMDADELDAQRQTAATPIAACAHFKGN